MADDNFNPYANLPSDFYYSPGYSSGWGVSSGSSNGFNPLDEIKPQFPTTLYNPPDRPNYDPPTYNPPTYNPPTYTPPNWPSWPSTPTHTPKAPDPPAQQQPKTPDLTPVAQQMAMMVAPQQNVIVGGRTGQPLPAQADRSFRGKDPGISGKPGNNYLDLLRAGFWGKG